MVLVTYQAIASHFKQLGDSPWVLAGYNLGYCVALPVVINPQEKREDVLPIRLC